MENIRTEDKKDKAMVTILTSESYEDAYNTLLEEGFDEIDADYYWSLFGGVCGDNL